MCRKGRCMCRNARCDSTSFKGAKCKGGQQTRHVFQKGQSITPLFLRSERALHNTTLTTASPTRFSHSVCVDSRPRIARQVHRGQNLLTFAGKSLATQHKPYRVIYQYFNTYPTILGVVAIYFIDGELWEPLERLGTLVSILTS